jgi:magnesium-protoporphyrin O-methyltransferase
MACSSHCAATATHFDRQRAREDRARYERTGPNPTTVLLLQELRPVTRAGDTLLDVGGGIGVLGLELQPVGLREVILVEASPAYLAEATALMGQSAGTARFQPIAGNFTEVTPPPAADLVTLDRVVCCYPDVTTLLQHAAASARRVLALSFPRERWYVRMAVWLENRLRQLRRDPFRTFVHPPAAMAALLRDQGWYRQGQRNTLSWCVERWSRPGAD